MTDEQEKKLQKIVAEGTPKSFTYNGKKIFISKNIINKLKDKIKDEKSGGVIPLLALLPAILAGVGSTAAVAGGVATAVNQAKQARKTDFETEKVKEELKQLKEHNKTNKENNEEKGEGIFLNKFEGRGVYDILKSKGLKLKTFKDNELKISKYGDGLYLFPKYN